MSNRKQAFKSNTNPATKWLEWSSNDGTFKYYDKEKKENILVELPLSFVVLDAFQTIRGWNDKSSSGIYANEVKYMNQPLIVKSFKGGIIAEGLYKDIKAHVNSAGGVYHKSIYCMDLDGSIFNIMLKGAAVQEFGELNKSMFPDYVLEVSDAENRIKGSVKYSVPLFNFGRSLNKELAYKADKAFDTLEAYMQGNNEVEQEQVEEKSDELPF
jgi:hypothetical protein